MVSCGEKNDKAYKNLTLNAFSGMKTPSFVIQPNLVRKHINRLMKEDSGRLPCDRFARKHYESGAGFIWISRLGIDTRPDTLIKYISAVNESGISYRVFRKNRIEQDMEQIKSLQFDAGEDINMALARLEYNLTRAYLRYCSGQKFGYVNPEYILNHFDVRDSDSIRTTYNRIFDIKLERPSQQFFNDALRKARKDSLSFFLQEVQPTSKLYTKLCQYLKSKHLNENQRQKVLCNIERCRWQQKEDFEKLSKYVLVNIPEFRLYTVDRDSIVSMKIGCGTKENKTPLLTSHIERMDINPQWVVPKSIARGIANNQAYLRKNNMFIYDKKKGKQDVSQASYSKIMDGQQFIVQKGGPGNSLGRIIFRFPNNFAVYLHDTSAPWMLQKSFRAISHGCIRVEKPFQLAMFLLEDKSSPLADKIQYSMTVDLNPNDSPPPSRYGHIDKKRLVNSVTVSPNIPVIITYFTYFPHVNGNLVEYADVYGFDAAILSRLKAFLI